MGSDPSGHGWRSLPCRRQTRRRRAKVLAGASQAQTLVQRQGVARPRSTTARQRREVCPDGRVQPFAIGGVAHPVPLRAASERLHACRRAIHTTACGRDHPPPRVAFDDLGEADVAPRTAPWPSPLPVCTGSRKVARLARLEDTTPSVQTKSGRGAAPRLPRAISRRSTGRARGSLPSPRLAHHGQGPPHHAAQLLDAELIRLPLSQITGLLDKGREHSLALTARSSPLAATGRSSTPNTATSACTGHLWASQVTTSTTVPAEVRSREKPVPVRALQVWRHAWPRKRGSFCAWRPLLPWPVWPLAGQRGLGQTTAGGP